MQRGAKRKPQVRFGWAGGLALLAVVAGCQGPRLQNQAPVPRASSAQLTAYLANQPYVTAEPAYRAAYFLHNGESFEGDYAALQAALRNEKLISPAWDHAPDEVLDRGTVGYLICRAIGVKTGLNWHLTGLGRYAWRELGYLDIAPQITEYGYVSGGLFVGLLNRGATYMRRYDQLPPEPELAEPAAEAGT